MVSCKNGEGKMKFVLFAGILCVLTGCARVNSLTAPKTTESEQTADPLYDEQTEMKVLVPWSLVI